MPTAIKLSSKKPARRRVEKKVSLPILKAVKGSPLAGLEPWIGCVTLPASSALPPAKSTTSELLKKVHAGDFAKHVDLGKVAAAVATRSSSRR